MKYTRYILSFICAFALASCAKVAFPEEERYFVGDGRVLDVNIPFTPVVMPEVTRAALNENQEMDVQDLYVFMFKLSSADDHNPVVINPAQDRYFTKEQFKTANIEPGHSVPTEDGVVSSGTISMRNIPSGTYWIAAMANVKFGDVDVNGLLTQLNAVTNWEEFCEVQVKLGTKANTSRTYICMSGYYLSEDSHAQHIDPDRVHGTTPPDKVIISQSGQLDGYVHLRRLDAQVHFTIKNGMVSGNPGNYPVATKFRIKSWQLVNLPDMASVIEEETDLCTSYSSTIQNFSGWTTTQGVGEIMTRYDLDFYMLENRGYSKAGHAINQYKFREEEEKMPLDPNGFTPNYDNPHYTVAPANSAYLVLEAEFQQTMPGDEESGGNAYMRDVEARYIIHLGYCEGEADNPGYTSEEDKRKCKANDFNTRRNTKYNYVVTINGANEIVVEAKREEIANNGTEGTVIDVKGGEVIDLDAHYAAFNITLTREELELSEFIIESPNGTWSSVGKNFGDPGYPDPWTEDYQHIRFAFNQAGTNQLKASQAVTKLVSYSKTYDHDCPEGTDISKIKENEHTLIPVHHEKKQIQDANHTFPLYDLYCLKKEYGSPKTATNPNGYVKDGSDANYREPLVFTVFVNELYYYYENGVIDKNEVYGTDGYVVDNETPRDYTMWTRFVNQTQGRSFRLLTDIKHSIDNDSHYLKCKINIRQRSIETYFGEHIIDGYDKTSPDLPAALGIEQINEHYYKNLSANFYSYNTGEKDSDGYGVTMSNLTNASRNTWAFHADQETVMGSDDGHTYPTFMTTPLQQLKSISEGYYYKTFASDHKNYELVDVPVNRNRDLNRDGVITKDEVRWFAPSSAQYVTFCVGAGALQTPLFNKANFDPAQTYWSAWPINWNYKKVYYNGLFHYLGTNKWYVVTEEAASTGKSATMSDDRDHDALDTQLSGEVRCARYLGVTNGDNGYDGINLPEPASFNQSNYVITTINYSKQMHRSARLGRIPPHDNLSIGNNGYNSIADYFQVSTQNSKPGMVIGGADGLNAEERLLKMMDDNYFCADYVDPVFGAGGWRAPNQVELALMYTYMPAALLPLGEQNTSVNAPNLISCTYWYRNDELQSQGSTAYEGTLKNGLKRHYLGARKDGEGRKLAMIHAGDLYGGKHYTVRCVRDTDMDGNPYGSEDYGKVLNFKFGPLTGSDGSFTSKATMHQDAVVKSVTIDGVGATVTHTGKNFNASATGVTNPYSFNVTWTIQFNGKEYIYSQIFVVKNTPFYAFRDNNVKTKAVTVENDLTVLRTESLDDSQLPDDCRWVLLRKDAPGFVIETPIVPTNGTYLPTKYILYNIGTAQYLGTSSNGTNNANNFTMVSERSQAMEFDLGGNNNGKLFRVSIGGTNNGYFDRKTDWSIGVNSGLRHAWVFNLRSYVSSITLDPSSVELTLGQPETETATVNATVLPLDATNRNVNWSSSNNGVATVNNGVVTAVGTGKATITATAADGSGVVAKCTVKVKQLVTNITLNQTTATLDLDKTLTLIAIVSPDDATEKSVTWESSNPDVAALDDGTATKSAGDQTITVKPVAPGSTIITATANDGSGVTARCTVTVKQPVTSITLPATASVGISRTITLTPTILPENATDKTVTWESSNTGIATVSNGAVTGKAQGTATITVRANDGSGRSATCNVTVSPVKVTSVSLNATSMNIGTGGSYTLKATVTPDDATNKNVNWSMSGSTNYFTLTQNGNSATIKCTKMSFSRVTVTVTATAADGSGKKASCTVNNM